MISRRFDLRFKQDADEFFGWLKLLFWRHLGAAQRAHVLHSLGAWPPPGALPQAIPQTVEVHLLQKVRDERKLAELWGLMKEWLPPEVLALDPLEQRGEIK